jgi:hypothetical protein
MHRDVIAASVTLVLLALATPLGSAQRWRPPTEAERCPSQWGAGDERGAANLMTPERVLRATRLVRTGEVIELGYSLYTGMPFYGDRVYSQQLKRTNRPNGSNTRGSNEEIVTTELGQVGTQIDGFAHQSIGDSLYNCVKMDAVATEGEFTAKVLSTRVDYAFTARMFISGFIQYNSSINRASSNFRYRWEYRPGSELFVVYTDERDMMPVPRPTSLRNRAFVVKVNRLFRF